MENRVILRMTFDPLAVNKSVGGTDIERIVANGNLLRFPTRITKMLRPVINVINLHASPGRDCCRPLAGGRQREDDEVPIIRNVSMGTAAGLGYSAIESLTRAPAQRRVIERVVDLVCILAQSAVQLFERPRGMIPRIDAGGNLPG